MVSNVRRIAGRVLVVAAMVSLSAASAFAQVEVSFVGGYTASEGIDASTGRPILGQVYNNLDIKSGGSFGLTAGAYVTPNVEVEFLWHRQFSELEISGPAPVKKLANQNVDNYMGNFVYNFGESDAKTRPFFEFGLGATHYTPGDYDSGIPGAATLAKIQGFSKFAASLGGGVKYYPGKMVGVKAGIRWTPTYIKSDPAGLWCDPFYPTCWVVGDADYSNQFEYSGGVVIRFGGK